MSNGLVYSLTSFLAIFEKNMLGDNVGSVSLSKAYLLPGSPSDAIADYYEFWANAFFLQGCTS